MLYISAHKQGKKKNQWNKWFTEILDIHTRTFLIRNYQYLTFAVTVQQSSNTCSSVQSKRPGQQQAKNIWKPTGESSNSTMMFLHYLSSQVNFTAYTQLLARMGCTSPLCRYLILQSNATQLFRRSSDNEQEIKLSESLTIRTQLPG